MNDAFPARLGQVVLVEDGADAVTGLVVGTDDGEVVLDLTSSADNLLGDVHVSIFAPEALYRAQAAATRDGSGRLVLAKVRDVEMIQRRRWPRREMAIPVSLMALDDPAPAGVQGETVDVGIGGTCVHTRDPLPAGADPMVTLTLPDGEPLMLPARVVFCRHVVDGWDYRLAFCDLDDADAAQLAELVSAV
jgi:PilZ domain-containing protein